MYDLATGLVRQITTDLNDQYSPSISGNLIVWQDCRNSPVCGDVYLYNLLTSKERRIDNDAGSQLNPRISGKYVVWEQALNADIHLYNVRTGTVKAITNDSFLQQKPYISGNRIVWEDNRNGNWDLYLYDIARSVEERLTTDPEDERNPVVINELGLSGVRVAWEHNHRDNWDISFLELATHQEYEIAGHSKSQKSVAMSWDRLVWLDERDGVSEIYTALRNPEQQLTSQGSSDNPNVWGNKIIWRNIVNEQSSIHGYNVATSSLEDLTGNFHNIGFSSSIWQNLIIWEYTPLVNNPNFLSDIYIHDDKTGLTQILTTTKGEKSQVNIFGDWLVWVNGLFFSGDVALYNRKTGIEKLVTNDSLAQVDLDMWGNRVVWAEGDFFNPWDIYSYDISSGRINPVTTAPGSQLNPAIWNDRVVWEDGRDCPDTLSCAVSNIYLYDFKTGKEQNLTGGGADKEPAIWSDRVLFVRNNRMFNFDLITRNEKQLIDNPTTEVMKDVSIWGNKVVWEEYNKQIGDIQVFLLELADSAHEADKTLKQVNHQWRWLNMGANFKTAPILLTAMQTTQEIDSAGLRIQGLGPTRFQVKVEEDQSLDPETTHVAETVGYFAVEPGAIRNTAGETIGEAWKGSISQANPATWNLVNLKRSYVNPVVMAHLATTNDPEPAHVRVRNVTPVSFELQIEEWDYEDGLHQNEEIHLVVMEKGRHTLLDGTEIEAGTADVGTNWASVTLTKKFVGIPVVLSQTQTANELRSVVTRQRSISSSGFEVMLQGQEKDSLMHFPETVGYIAVTPTVSF